MTGKAQKSQLDILIELGLSSYELFRVGQTPYAVPLHGARIAFPIGGRGSIKHTLMQMFHRHTGKGANSDAVAAALNTLSGYALEQEQREVHIRVARHDGQFWIDIGDETGQAIRVGKDGWAVLPRPPESVLFRRTALTKPLPIPDPSAGPLDVFRLFRHVRVDDGDKPLVLADLIAALDPDIPHPVVIIDGQQGSAKSTGTEILVNVIDPAVAPTRKQPKDSEEWVTAAQGSWRVALDNIGRAGIPDWLSDSLCRAATGTGDVRRRLYADDELKVFNYKRSCLVNGIRLGRMSEDLIDRALPLHFSTIDPSERKDDRDVKAAWEAEHPIILASLLNLASCVLSAYDGIHLGEKRPRMADFGRYLAAVDHVLYSWGVQGSQFTGLDRYLERRDAFQKESVDDDPFLDALESYVRTQNGEIAEKSTTLLRSVERWQQTQSTMFGGGRLPDGWPRTPSGVGTKLSYAKPALEAQGWTIVKNYDSDSKTNRWMIKVPVTGATGYASSASDSGIAGCDDDSTYPDLNGHRDMR